MSRISELAANYPRSAIRDMFRFAANYPDAVNLCNGQPNFETPQHIVDACCRAVQSGGYMTKYATEPGLPSMREAIANKYTEQFGFEFTPDECMATLGGVEAVWLSMATILNPGDEVIIPDPAYTCYEGQALSLHAVPVRVPLREENGFQLIPEELEQYITPRTKAIVLCYPSNPIGAALSKPDAEKLAEVLVKHDIMVLSDEVYEKLLFDGRTHFSMAQIPEMRNNVVVINSLSKTYAMTGWRVGYAVCKDKEIMSGMAIMQQAVASCLPTFIMQAAAEAISGPQDCVEEMRQQYERRRNLLYNGLCEVPGMKPFKTEGSFCTFINIKEILNKYNMTSHDFSMKLLSEGRVMNIAGSAFGSMGEGYLRLCFANSDENIIEGVRRIKEYVTTNLPV